MFKGHALLIATLAFSLTACKSQEQKAAEQAAKQLEEASKKMEEATKSGQVNVGDAMSALGAAMGAANAGRKVETVGLFEGARIRLPTGHIKLVPAIPCWLLAKR